MTEERFHSLVPSEYVAPPQDFLDLCKGREEGPPSPDGSSMLPSPSRWVQYLWPESYRVACSLCWTGNQAGMGCKGEEGARSGLG